MSSATRARPLSLVQRLVRSRGGFIAALLFLPAVAVWRQGINGWLALVYGLMLSLFTYGLYWHDKRRAQSEGWRVPESTLHVLAMAGGWPGAYFAQRQLRHKTAKKWFQVVFWAIIVFWQIVALVLLV